MKLSPFLTLAASATGKYTLLVHDNDFHGMELILQFVELSGQCFKDVPARYLNGAQYKNTPNMTVEKCIRLCLKDGFVYAGVEYSTQCFCGDTAPTITARNCNMECAGNKKQVCGGGWAMNVYSTTKKAYSCEQATKTSLETCPVDLLKMF